MKCSGKQHLYPAEVFRLKKETRERKFNDVINQTEMNTENLEVLDRKIHDDVLMLVSNVKINLTNAVNDIKEDILRNITYPTNQVAENTMGRLSGPFYHI